MSRIDFFDKVGDMKTDPRLTKSPYQKAVIRWVEANPHIFDGTFPPKEAEVKRMIGQPKNNGLFYNVAQSLGFFSFGKLLAELHEEYIK